MRLIFAGTPEFAVPSLRALHDAGHDIVGVITREDAPLGRKRVITPSPVAQTAEELGLEIHRTNRLGTDTESWVAARKPDLGVIVAYGGLVHEPLLSMPSLGWINLHFSDLPSWRGAAPVQRALMSGEQTLGVTVFRLVAALDAGTVLTRDHQHMPLGTTAGAALAQLAEIGSGTLVSAVDHLHENPAAGTPQQGAATYAAKLTREDGKLNLEQNAEQVLAHWAGVTPEPGAYVSVGDAALKLLDVALTPAQPGGVPGEVALIDGEAILTLPGTTPQHRTALVLRRVQPAGKSAMDGAAWLRGRNGRTVLA